MLQWTEILQWTEMLLWTEALPTLLQRQCSHAPTASRAALEAPPRQRSASAGVRFFRMQLRTSEFSSITCNVTRISTFMVCILVRVGSRRRSNPKNSDAAQFEAANFLTKSRSPPTTILSWTKTSLPLQPMRTSCSSARTPARPRQSRRPEHRRSRHRPRLAAARTVPACGLTSADCEDVLPHPPTQRYSRPRTRILFARAGVPVPRQSAPNLRGCQSDLQRRSCGRQPRRARAAQRRALRPLVDRPVHQHPLRATARARARPRQRDAAQLQHRQVPVQTQDARASLLRRANAASCRPSVELLVEEKNLELI